jgi:hypothetical protein
VSARVEKASAGRLATDRRVKEPRVTSRMVRAEDADKSQPQFQEVKPKARAEKPQARPAIHRPTPPDRGKRKTDVAGTAATGGAPKDAEAGKPQRPRRPEKAVTAAPAKETEPGRPHKPERPEKAVQASPGKDPAPPIAAPGGESARPERPPRSEKAVKAPPARGADRPPTPERAARPATPESLGTPAKLGQGGNGEGQARPGTLDRPAGQTAKPRVKAAERPRQPQQLSGPAERAPQRRSQPQQQGEERQGKGKQKGE